MEEFDPVKATAQIEQGVTVLVPRLTHEEIDAFSVPRKRQAKRKYHFLSFDLSDDEEEEDFFIYAPTAKRNKRDKWYSASSSPSSSAVVSSTDEEVVLSERKNSKEIPSSSASLTAEKAPFKKRNSKETRRKHSLENDAADQTSLEKAFDESTKNDSKSSLDKLKPLITTEVKLLKRPNEEPVTYLEPMKKINDRAGETKISPVTKFTPVNPLVGKIRIKSAAELGSTVIFIDDVPIPTAKAKPAADNPKTASFKKTNTTSTSKSKSKSTSTSTSKSKSKSTSMSMSKSKNTSSRSNVSKTETPGTSSEVRKGGGIDVQMIQNLYARLFAVQNQTKIRNVAEILQSIAENIKNNNERVQEITNNKSLTDAEKLMRRCLAFQDLKRRQEENEVKLKEKFEALMTIFDNDNFELYFKLFFLGILKILIVSVSYFYKKGTIFKKLITLLLQSLTNSKFNDDRIFKLLRSKDFRDGCITLVQFIEKYCRTDSFSMLFLSDADKNLIKNKNSQGPSEPPLQRNVSPEVSSVKERESFLLHLLKESKAIDAATPSAANQQQNKYKTYAPASKRNISSSSSSSSSLPATTSAPKPAANTNGIVNSFIFSDGQIKPYPNNVINIHTTEVSRPGRPPPPHYPANNHLRRAAATAPAPAPASVPVLVPGNPVHLTYQVNSSFNALHKVQLINGSLNGTQLLSISNGNIENIQPGSYDAINKKVGKDNTSIWNGATNVNANYSNPVTNVGPRLEHYGGTFATPLDPRNVWMG